MQKISKFRAEKVILFLGLLVSIFVSFFLYKESEREDYHQFSDVVNASTLTFKSKIEANEVVLESIASFYYFSNFVDREEFRTFVTPLLKRYPFIKALEWIPKVPFKDKKKFIDLASNGLEAVEACDNYQYSIILMDMQMPVLDGIGATKKILAKHTENPPKIIAMTANAFEEDREKCLNAGMVEFISKPMQLDKVMDVLSKVLN